MNYFISRFAYLHIPYLFFPYIFLFFPTRKNNNSSPLLHKINYYNKSMILARDIYFEKQGMLNNKCGLHALNNLLGSNLFK